MRRKKLEKKIDADTDTVRNDLRKLRDDLANIVRSRRRRGSEEIDTGGARVREVVTEVRERPARRGEYPEPPQRWNPGSAVRKHPKRRRRLATLAALGAAAYLLLRKRKVAVTASVEPRRGWRAWRPWTARSRRTVIEAETYEPPVGAMPSESGDVTVVREEAPVEKPEKVTSF